MNTFSRRTFVRNIACFLITTPNLYINPRSSIAAPETTEINITGSSTIAPLLQEIAHRYIDIYPDIKIDVQAGGSSRGISDVRRKISDIGMVSRRLKAEESDLAKTLIAYDGIAMIIHKDNNIDDISIDEIKNIYRGAVRSWKYFGGADADITVVSKSEGRSTLEIFLSETEMSIKEIKSHIIVGDNEQAVKIVEGNPRSIAYISIGTAEYHIKSGAPIKMIGLGDVPPSTKSVANGTYKAIRELNLVTLSPKSPQIIAFEDFVVSEKNYDAIAEYYFVPPGR